MKQASDRSGTSRPEKVFRSGDVVASVWANKRRVNGELVTFKSVSVAKRYQDKDGEWKTAHSYNAQDLKDQLVVAQAAINYLEPASHNIASEEVDLTPASGSSPHRCAHGGKERVQNAFNGVKLAA